VRSRSSLTMEAVISAIFILQIQLVDLV
jgi:hypothetical protein